MSTPTLAIVAFTLLATACSARAMGPPQIAVDRTSCSHCGMFVSEPVYASAYQAAGNDPRVVEDIGCMLEALRRETASPITVWLQDAAGAGWIDAAQATVVSAPRLSTPMSGGWLAYADAAAAAKAAGAHGGTVVGPFARLLTREGDAK